MKYIRPFLCIALSLSLLSCKGAEVPQPKDEPHTTNQEKEPEPEIEPEPDKVSLDGKTFIFCGNSMLYYGGIVANGGQKGTDAGMFYTLLKKSGVTGHRVIDCTYGGHHLCDFGEGGCIFTDKHGSDGKTSSGGCPGIGYDLIGGIDLSTVDYVIISEAGNNYSHFYDDAKTLFERFTKVNPDAKLVYINHIYSVYKKHTNVLGKLKDLHDNLGVTIVNCGQLAYDIYTKAISVPGGSVQYSDRYTFCNHAGSDTYHPNPLMGYIMTRMLYCALTGEKAEGAEYSSLVKGTMYGASAAVSYSAYYDKYYSGNPAAVPFMTVIDNEKEMSGIHQLIPLYIDKY